MGGALPISFLLILSLLLFLIWPSQAMNAVVMDGVAEWKRPIVQVGDSLVFMHKHHLQNLYLFHNRRAFDLCSFSQATLIYDGSNSSHFTWHPARPGYYFFSTKDSSGKRCEKGEKLFVRVITPDPAPSFPIALPPTAGGDLPSHGWAVSSPSSTPSPAPEAAAPAAAPSSSGPLEPRNEHAPSNAPLSDSGGGIPFISSNPAVPLPSEETDSATILPVSSPRDGNQVVGQGSILRAGTSWLMVVVMAFFGLVVESYCPFGTCV